MKKKELILARDRQSQRDRSTSLWVDQYIEQQFGTAEIVSGVFVPILEDGAGEWPSTDPAGEESIT